MPIRNMKGAVVLTVLALAVAPGCSLLVDFNESKIVEIGRAHV